MRRSEAKAEGGKMKQRLKYWGERKITYTVLILQVVTKPGENT